MTTPTAADGGHGSKPEHGMNHALHVWAWLSNPNGLTNPANPNVDTTYCP